MKTMSRLIKVLAFLALFAFFDRLLETSAFRAATINSFVDSVSLAIGIESKYIDFALISLMALGILWSILFVSRCLNGMMKHKPM